MAQKSEKKQEKKNTGNGRKYLAVIGIVVVFIAVAGGLVYGLGRTQPTSFSTFKQNFDSAPRVAIYATGYNGTQLGSTIGCATAVIESIVGSSTYHRNSSTIDLYVMNSTACTFENGIGGQISNYSFNSIGNCLSASQHEPSIFINYSETNITRITPTTLHISGNEQFLELCGVASEIT